MDKAIKLVDEGKNFIKKRILGDSGVHAAHQALTSRLADE
jgi:hypothetical protein